ncbi:hypothetical protein K402DRAFT_397854 [Aulographum hederae CBS 113979]|uniref:Glycerate dehydrogenase n=1 Tax=Aulographum hederae CBS 113979 TaxID=1176131 RepID=A0A6G1GMG7_9PEZI|nr:hypothetical protein K402DRAFT_397854 [Aulographum hederae CBS 113979]
MSHSEHIVVLESIHFPIPKFDLQCPHTIDVHPRTSPDQLHECLRDATIAITTTTPLDAEALSEAVSPKLRLVNVTATGTDIIDKDACRKRGIRVWYQPGANLAAVSEHAIGLYFAARRKTVQLHNATASVPSEWKAKGTLSHIMRDARGNPPVSCEDETVGIIGYGALGKRIAKLAKALGMNVLISGRKSQPTKTTPGQDISNISVGTEDIPRVPFPEVIRRATVLILSLPRDPSTVSLLSTPEFSAMQPSAIVINVSRGGIVDEAALLAALKDSQISGYASDVLAVEPAEGEADSVLLSKEARGLNITLSPHLAWFAERTMTNLQDLLKGNIEAWCRGEERNVVV